MCSKAAAILRKLLGAPQKKYHNLKPPALLYPTSSTSDESELCSINDGHSSINHATPMVSYTQPDLGYEDGGNQDGYIMVQLRSTDV